MKSYDIEGFLNAGSSNVANWKDDGKILFALSKKGEMFSRLIHQFPVVRTGDGGKPYVGSHRCICEEYQCPIDHLVEICRGLEDDAPVLQFKVGNKTETWTASDITGANGNKNWKRKQFARSEWVFQVVRIPVKDDAKLCKEVLILSKDAGDKVRELIKTQIEQAVEDGNDPSFGNPIAHPYVIRVKFNKESATPGGFYSASKSERKIDAVLKKMLLETPADASKHLQATDHDEIIKLIKKACINQTVLKKLAGSIEIENAIKENSTKRIGKPKKIVKKMLKKRHDVDEDDDDDLPDTPF